MDREDAYWAAKQVAVFTDAEIRALVDTGEYSDRHAAEWMTQCLIKRRDKIAEACFSKVLPLDKFSVEDGKLMFENVGENRGIGRGREYSMRWASRDDAGRITPLPHAVREQVPAFRDDTKYLLAMIAPSGVRAASADRVIVYLRRGQMGLEVVGVDR
jgi:hypothetical protein